MLCAAFADGGQQLVLFHHPEPGDRPQRRADRDDVDGDKVHPRSPFGDRLHADAAAEANRADEDQRRPAVQARETVQQRFGHRLKHVLQRADARKDHGEIEDDRKQAAKRNVLQDLGQRDEQQTRTRADIHAVGKACGDDDQRRDQRRDGVKQRRMPRDADDVLLLIQICAVDDHAAAGDRQREEGLPHGGDPDRGVFQRLPARDQHEKIALARTGQKRRAHGEDQKDQKEQRHHDLVGLLDAVCAEEQREQRADDHDHMVRHDREAGLREGGEPGRRVGVHQRPRDRIGKRLQHIGNDDRIADGDAERTGQRQPAERPADLPRLFSARPPRIGVGAERSRPGAAADGKLGRQPDIAEDDDKQQIDQQERAAAVRAHFVGESPHIRHADGRTDRGQNEAPAAAE